jgi:nucleoid-associated protein YgaU
MSIARQFYNDASKYKLIQEANKIDDPNHIVVGQKLVIPEID